jgi:hypothetical protein
MMAALLNPKRRVLVVAGDGGFMMNSQELETARRLKLDLDVLVIEDHAYGMIRWKQAVAAPSPMPRCTAENTDGGHSIHDGLMDKRTWWNDAGRPLADNSPAPTFGRTIPFTCRLLKPLEQSPDRRHGPVSTNENSERPCDYFFKASTIALIVPFEASAWRAQSRS